MSTRSQRISNGVSRLSPTTYVPDCGDEVRYYLQKIGHARRTIGSTPVFVLRRWNRIVTVAGSAEELHLPASAPGSTRYGGVASVSRIPENGTASEPQTSPEAK